MSDLIPAPAPAGGEFLFYQSDDGRIRLQVRVQQETVWLSLNQMADLFQRDKSVISRHISNIFEEGELGREATSKARSSEHRTSPPLSNALLREVHPEFFRVRSPMGVRFRQWAADKLNGYN